jgi:hypothetical protein
MNHCELPAMSVNGLGDPTTGARLRRRHAALLLKQLPPDASGEPC